MLSTKTKELRCSCRAHATKAVSIATQACPDAGSTERAVDSELSRPDAPQTRTGFSIQTKLPRKLDVGATGYATNTDRVVKPDQNFEDTPRRSIRTHCEYGESCRFPATAPCSSFDAASPLRDRCLSIGWLDVRLIR